MSLPAFPFTWFRRTTRDTKDEPMIADVETPRPPDPLRWLVLASFCANGFISPTGSSPRAPPAVFVFLELMHPIWTRRTCV